MSSTRSPSSVSQQGSLQTSTRSTQSVHLAIFPVLGWNFGTSSGCPVEVPKFHPKTGKMAKCTLCVDRVEVWSEPCCDTLDGERVLDIQPRSRGTYKFRRAV